MRVGRIGIESNESISRFIKLTYMTIRSTGKIPLRRLESAYSAICPCMHEHVQDGIFDIGAFGYVSARLPECIFASRNIILGQSETFFEEMGVAISSWNEVYAKSRRRRYLYDGNETIVAFISSKSDIDDVIPSLLCLQIEWNKAFQYFSREGVVFSRGMKAAEIEMKAEDILGLERGALHGYSNALVAMSQRSCNFTVQNYEASYCRYRKETEIWWQQIRRSCPDVEERKIYFVSSNTHSLINLISGFAESIADEILGFAKNDPSLVKLVEQYFSKNTETMQKKNILYYLLMKYENSSNGVDVSARRVAYEQSVGIMRVRSLQTLDVPTQIIDLRKVAASCSERDTGIDLPVWIKDTDALILNIDYPLGRTAYFILNKISEHVSSILGVYVIGKAASLFAQRGDILIPTCIYDQHTRNQYFFTNSISAKDVMKYIKTEEHGIYDNQKAVTVLGTLLQNVKMLNDFLLDGITDLEMEAGPYLSAVYEILEPKRYPENESITFSSPEFDFGIVHYVSDNPLSTDRLSTGLALDGIDATYAVTRVVMDRIKNCLEERYRR